MFGGRYVSGGALRVTGDEQRKGRSLIHYYVALAPRSPLRPLLVAKAEKQAERLARLEKVDKLKKKVNSWAARLSRARRSFLKFQETAPIFCTIYIIGK